VVDASRLQPSLELTLELSQLGRPVVMALNRMDEASRKGLAINVKALQHLLGIPVVPTVALMGQGLTQLFAAAAGAARSATCPVPPAPSRHIAASLEALSAALNREDVHAAFRVPHGWLLAQFAARDEFIETELAEHFATRLPELESPAGSGGLCPATPAGRGIACGSPPSCRDAGRVGHAHGSARGTGLALLAG
jgi:ferrous iron transport protein B